MNRHYLCVLRSTFFHHACLDLQMAPAFTLEVTGQRKQRSANFIHQLEEHKYQFSLGSSMQMEFPC
jgi:hypothetical protein